MRLALATGRTLRELLNSVDAEELALWQAYYQVEPFGADRVDYPIAILTNVVHSALGGKSSVGDFIPKFGRPDQQSRDQKITESVMAFIERMKRYNNGQ